MVENHETSRWWKEEGVERVRQLEREAAKQQALTCETLEALANALEAKSPYLTGHSARVATLAVALGRELKLPSKEIERVRMAACLHDLGMIGVREPVVNKEGPLSDEEYEHVKNHVVIGSTLLAPLTYLRPIVAIVRGHHEHWDGTGYPDGLSGEDIPVGARIIGALEVYDALTTARPYQEPLEPAQAISRMQILAGSHLDPNVMEALRVTVERQ